MGLGWGWGRDWGDMEMGIWDGDGVGRRSTGDGVECGGDGIRKGWGEDRTGMGKGWRWGGDGMGMGWDGNGDGDGVGWGWG